MVTNYREKQKRNEFKKCPDLQSKTQSRVSVAAFLGGGPGEGPGGGGGPVDLRTEPRVGSHSGGASGVDTALREQQLQQELVLLKQQQELQKQLLFAEFQKKHEVLTRQHEVQLQEHLKVLSQVFTADPYQALNYSTVCWLRARFRLSAGLFVIL